MAVIPTLETGKMAQVAHQVKQEQFEQQRIQLAQRQQAIQVFNNQVNSNMQRLGMQQRQEAAERQAGFKATELAVELGIKYEPGTRSMRPLKPEDPEFAPWKERQAERKAKRPLTLEQRVSLEERREAARVRGAIATEAGKRVVAEPFERAKFGRAVELFNVKQDRFVKDKVVAEERAAGRKLTETERTNAEFRARAEFGQGLKRDIATFTEDLRRERPKDPGKAIDRLDKMRRQAQTGLRSTILSRERALDTFKRRHIEQFDPASGSFNKGGETPAVEADWVRLNSTLDSVVQDAMNDVTKVQQLEGAALTLGATPPAAPPVPMAPEAAPGGAVVAGAEEAAVTPEGQPIAAAEQVEFTQRLGEPSRVAPIPPTPKPRIITFGNKRFMAPTDPAERQRVLGELANLLGNLRTDQQGLAAAKNPADIKELRATVAEDKERIRFLVSQSFQPVQ